MAHLHDEIHLSCLSVASAVAKKMGKKWSASDFHWKNYFQKVKESWKAPKRTSWSPGGSIKQRFTWNPSRPDLFSSASRENQEIDVSAFKKNAQAAVAKVSSLRVHLDFPYFPPRNLETTAGFHTEALTGWSSRCISCLQRATDLGIRLKPTFAVAAASLNRWGAGIRIPTIMLRTWNLRKQITCTKTDHGSN